jgi:hypothetical protein
MYEKGANTMTKKTNKGSNNQNSPRAGQNQTSFENQMMSGDNSKGSKRNKSQNDKTD